MKFEDGDEQENEEDETWLPEWSVEARTQATLTEAIGLDLQTITSQDAMDWFASCGYSVIQNAQQRSCGIVCLIEAECPVYHVSFKQ